MNTSLFLFCYPLEFLLHCISGYLYNELDVYADGLLRLVIDYSYWLLLAIICFRYVLSNDFSSDYNTFQFNTNFCALMRYQFIRVIHFFMGYEVVDRTYSTLFNERQKKINAT